MSEVKWIKLTVDMFDNRKIKYLRKQPDGDSIVLIWIMLLTMAGRCNAGGFIFLTQDVHYTSKMLADELGFEESTVQLALGFLEQMNMINTQCGLCVCGWEEHQNIDGLEKIRESKRLAQARWRAKTKELSTVESTVDSERISVDYADKEKDIDKDIKQYSANFERFWKCYPKKVGKDAAYKSFKRAREDVEVLISAVEVQRKSDQWCKENGRYIPNPSTWLNQGRWKDETAETAERKIDMNALRNSLSKV